VPAHQASGKAELLLPLGLSLGGSIDYVGEQYFGSDAENAQGLLSDYWLLGVFATYRPTYLPGRLEVYFGLDNLLDVAYATTGFYDPWGPPDLYYYPGEGRSWKVGASYRY
jgi:outer membrane receptor protein involved in Fe transport